MTRAAEHPVPDRHGQNLYSTDAELLKLLPLYLPPALLAHMQPHFERLGALAGGPLDELAHTADINPPTLSQRSRTGLDEQRVIKHPAYVEMERLALSEFGIVAPGHTARHESQVAEDVRRTEEADDARLAEAMREVPKGATAVAAIAVVLLLVGWFLLYFAVFIGNSRFAPPTVGVVLPGHPAEGKLRPGDRILDA